ncbi:MAG TPA: ATP-binding protein [Rhizomicrobium sp.]|jgi:two-component system cell cycle sensor histidine kinase PleC|nr:ATP-binding protein [Rhizomicrobium sp.]
MAAGRTVATFPVGVQGDRLALEQLRLTLKNVKPNCWLMPLLAMVICVMFARWISVSVLVFWLALVILGGTYLGVVVYTFLGKGSDDLGERNWTVHAAVGYALFAMSWASLAFLFWRDGNDLNQMLILLLIACTLAGNAALVGASKPLSIVGYSIYGFALVIDPLREGGIIYDGLALLALGYVCYLAYMSRQIYFTARDMLLLRDDKNGLIEALAHSKEESDLARERAEAASRAKSEFLANMSHELRTPLNAILGFSEMIFSNALGTNPGRYKEYAKLVHESGNHLLALVNDILDLAKIESGKLELRESEVDLAALISEMVRLLADQAAAAQLNLVTEIEADLPLVLGDGRAFRQILINLLSNAIKFTPAGGEVGAFADLSDTREIVLGVRDTGAGIDPRDQLRVFSSFGQGRHDIAANTKGAGLGLAIVKGLCEAHGGRVTLASQLGKGTCVTIALPATRALPSLKQAS